MGINAISYLGGDCIDPCAAIECEDVEHICDDLPTCLGETWEDTALDLNVSGFAANGTNSHGCNDCGALGNQSAENNIDLTPLNGSYLLPNLGGTPFEYYSPLGNLSDADTIRATCPKLGTGYIITDCECEFVVWEAELYATEIAATVVCIDDEIGIGSCSIALQYVLRTLSFNPVTCEVVGWTGWSLSEASFAQSNILSPFCTTDATPTVLVEPCEPGLEMVSTIPGIQIDDTTDTECAGLAEDCTTPDTITLTGSLIAA